MDFLVYVRAEKGHDANGNARRGWIHYVSNGGEAKVFGFYREEPNGFEGSVPASFHKLPRTERLTIANKEFRALAKLGR